jgi:hypothetical protein
LNENTNNTQIAIKCNGSNFIDILNYLKSIGGINKYNYTEGAKDRYYFLSKNNNILCSNVYPDDYAEIKLSSFGAN